MQQTETLQLGIISPEEEKTTYTRDLMRAIAGTDNSNMQKIDAAFKNIKTYNDEVAEMLEEFNNIIDEMCLEPLHLAAPAMGQRVEKGPLELYEIQGNTVLGGTPAYDAPVSMASVEGPLTLNISGKNLLDFSKFYKETDTKSGITFSADEQNGAIKLSGLCNDASGRLMISFSDTRKGLVTYLPAGTYTLRGNREEYYSNGLTVYANIRDLNNQYINDYPDVGNGCTFELSSDSLMQLRFIITNGANMDGVLVYPQIEAGGVRTNHMPHQGRTVKIPLVGTDRQTLAPLRMAYKGNGSVKTACYDRIVRVSGIWTVERNTREIELTGMDWVKGTNYPIFYPVKDGNRIADCAVSNFPYCTHFIERGSSDQADGVWASAMICFGENVLPSGPSTTTAELKQFCSQQAQAGTPVRVCYALSEPVYEELHQDVQVLLNTLSVPGGTCSVWFEGDILPSADIGLPRGDYPNAGVEGAYRWLGELSNPLPIPTQDDLFAWALEQQRGGVFATDGGATTKNVPEAGNLTGILSVTKQGQEVSMLVFGPTGKLHTANRLAGVWRGWTTLYSPLSKPTSDDLGAFSLRGGTAIPAKSDLNDYRTVGNYYCMLTADAKTLLNCPVTSAFTLKVFETNGSAAYKGQLLYTYNAQYVHIRYYAFDTSSWGEWTRLARMNDITLGALGITATKEELNRLDGTTGVVTNNLAALSLAPTVSIPSASNLDDYLTPGSYRVTSAEIAATIVNSPVNNVGFDLHVIQPYGLGTTNNQRTQIIMTSTGRFYLRTRDLNDIFSDWKEMKLFGTALSDLGITAKASDLNAVAKIIDGDLRVHTMKADSVKIGGMSVYSISNDDSSPVDCASINITSDLTADEGIIINFGGNILAGVNNPKDDNDAANKAYVDSEISSIQMKVDSIKNQIGDIAAQLDAINGEVV